MGEIETKAVRRHFGTPLLHVGTEYASKGGVQQVGRRMITHDRSAALGINLDRYSCGR